VNIDLKFPSGKITKQYERCMGEPVNYGVSSPRLSKNGGVGHTMPVAPISGKEGRLAILRACASRRWT
jgi:hypothetical protein